MTTLTQPVKWHGGKHYLAPKIVALFPPKASERPGGYVHYVEPFFGAGISEVVCDIDGELTAFWKVLRSPALFPAFARAVEATEFGEAVWRQAAAGDGPGGGLAGGLVGRAWCFFVRYRQSLAGRGESFSPLSRRRTRRWMNEQASAWLTAVEGLPAVHARLKRVVVLAPRPAADVIEQQDGPGTLFYLDPPYLPATRSAPSVYDHEMTTEEDHAHLLAVVWRCQGKVVLSGYPSPLYDDVLRDWRRVTFDLPNHAAGGPAKARMTEACWLNY